LQCACYMEALGLRRGIVWNVRNNVRYELEILHRRKFLHAVSRAITKGLVKKCYVAEGRKG